MKRILTFLLILIAIQSTAQTEKSNYQKFMFDNEKDFTQSQVDSLQQLLEGHYKMTGNVIAVVTTDITGGDIDRYIDRFGMDSLRVQGDKLNSMIIFMSIKEKNFTMFPDKKLRSILTHDVLDKISKSGYSDLKTHSFFTGIWKECKAVLNFWKKREAVIDAV